MVFFSNFGQTFLLSLYIPSFLDTFEISRSYYSALYSAATLLSALLIIFGGKYIDKVSLKKFSIVVVLGISAAAILAAISMNLVMLFFAIFMLRFFGQGMLGHIAMTTMGKYFHIARGKALSIAYMGFPLGEALLPVSIVSLIALLGWRETMFISGAFIFIVLMSIVIWSLGTFKADNVVESFDIKREKETEEKKVSYKPRPLDEAVLSQSDVLKNKYFYLFAPMVMITGFTLTALFFFQTFIADYKAWPIELMAAGITSYAISSIVFSIMAGPLIDKFSARKLFPFVLIPLSLGILILNTSNHNLTPFIFWAIIGISAGIHTPVSNALFAEVFGTKSLGAIRSLFTFAMVLSTAIAPVIYSFFLDLGYSFNDIHWGMITIILSISALTYIFTSKLRAA